MTVWTFIGWTAMLLSFTGIYMNARKNIWCWPVWLVSNAFWLVLGLHYRDSAIIIANFGFATGNSYGWVQWAKARRHDKRNSQTGSSPKNAQVGAD